MKNTWHNTFFAMNTRCDVVLPGLDYNKADQVYHKIKLEINRIEKKLSRFIPESEISIINKQAFKKPVILDEELFDILNTCKKYSELTEGAFDITLRPLMNFWKEKKEDYYPGNEFPQLIESVGMKHIHIDKNKKSISFDNELIEIDLGGFGKGYAMEKIDELLCEHHIEHAFISFGESTILARGCHPGGDCWKVGLNDYLNPGSSVHEFVLNNGSMSTSANFYLNDSGTLCNHRHVIDPETGYPVKECIQVSVSGESSTITEILSTAFLVSSDTMIQKAKGKLAGLEIVKVDYSSGKSRTEQF